MTKGHNIPKGCETLDFKSELVDISVPRAGTPEARVDIHDITHLSDLNWTVPPNTQHGGGVPHPNLDHGAATVQVLGWNYHAIENINLYSDIEQGLSTAAHKKDKRLTRGAAALNKLRYAADHHNQNHNGNNVPDHQLRLDELMAMDDVHESMPWAHRGTVPSYQGCLKAELRKQNVFGINPDDKLQALYRKYLEEIFTQDQKLHEAQ
ncbi:MAG: hypothetical protein AAFV29_23325, partial [Myxococcota bacterium]